MSETPEQEESRMQSPESAKTAREFLCLLTATVVTCIVICTWQAAKVHRLDRDLTRLTSDVGYLEAQTEPAVKAYWDANKTQKLRDQEELITLRMKVRALEEAVE